MKRFITLLYLVLSVALFPNNVCGQIKKMSLSEAEERAASGMYLCQALLGDLYLIGESDVIYGYPDNVADTVKAVNYYLMAAENPEQSEMAKEDKSRCMLNLANIYSTWNLLKIGSFENKDEAFYWSYAALQNGLSPEKNEKWYQYALYEAMFGMYDAAENDERFLGEYMYFSERRKSYGSFFFKPIHYYAEEKGYTPVESLRFKVSRAKDGSNAKYVGEIVNGRAHGIGILMSDAYTYYGSFTNGVRNGKGHCKYKSDGRRAVGEWKEGRLHNGMVYGTNGELKEMYKEGKFVYTIPESLRIGEADSRGDTIPQARYMGLSVRWAVGLMGENSSDPIGDLYHWGATNPEHEYQSADASQPHYMPRFACLAIYGGADRQSDIVGTGYDAPHCLWSSSWRMPTVAEMKELITKSEIGIEPNSSKVVFRRGEVFQWGWFAIDIPWSPDGYGIWTGSIDPEDNNKAYALILDEETWQLTIQSRDRECEFAILPVTDRPFYKSHLHKIP